MVALRDVLTQLTRYEPADADDVSQELQRSPVGGPRPGANEHDALGLDYHHVGIAIEGSKFGSESLLDGAAPADVDVGSRGLVVIALGDELKRCVGSRLEVARQLDEGPRRFILGLIRPDDHGLAMTVQDTETFGVAGGGACAHEDSYDKDARQYWPLAAS